MWPRRTLTGAAAPAVCDTRVTLASLQVTSKRNGKPETDRLPQSNTLPDCASRARQASTSAYTCDAAYTHNALHPSAAINTSTGIRNSRHSFCLRGGRAISDIGDLVRMIVSIARCMRALTLAHFDASGNSASRARHARQKISPARRQRRALGVRLWLADVAARVLIYRAGAGAGDRRASRAVRLFVRPPRHAGKARACARARPRRRLPGH